MENEFLTKAKENLKAAELLFEQGLYNASANRAYYAAFQAAIAALADIGISVHIGDRVGHEAVQSNFATELIHRRKVYPSRLKSYLKVLQAVRNDADYKTKGVSKRVALQQLKQAQEFVECVRKVINRMINFKQRELSQQLFEQLHDQFPDVELVSITESFENPYDIWVNMVMPEDEEREIALRELAGELSTDILLDYGYSITISAEPRRVMVAA